MDGLFDHLHYWHWWILGLLLLILEIFSPAAFFMWMGIGAGITGVILFFVPGLGWETQFVLFALLSIVSISAARLWLRRNPIHSDHPLLNLRGDELVGKVFIVESAIVNGSGRVRVGESNWKVEGPDCEAGASVRVVGADAAVLKVEPV
jgi:membrane protein implicated in regulation of membrane protease activity